MSPFDRLQLDACLVRLRTAMDADAMAAADGINGSRWRKIADRATVEIYEAVEALEAALDEIDRLTRILRAAVDDVPGYPCGCSHERSGSCKQDANRSRPSSSACTRHSEHRMRTLLSPMASAAMVGCAACATLSWPNRELWYLWITLAGVALLVATVTRDW